MEDKDGLIAKIDAALDDVRPHLKVDGGNIEVVDVNEDFDVQVRWLGNCHGCSMSAMTLRAGVEEAIRNRLPQIRSVTPVN